MKTFRIASILFLPMLICLISSCEKDDVEKEIVNNVINNPSVQGTIQLSGSETPMVGTSLDVGNIVLDRADLTGTSDAIILLDESVSLTASGLQFNDTNNNFVIVVADLSNDASTPVDKTISMTIIKNGVEYDFACLSPVIGAFTGCGNNFIVDLTNKRIVFDNTTVENTSTNVILTMNGIVNWN